MSDVFTGTLEKEGSEGGREGGREGEREKRGRERGRKGGWVWKREGERE